HSTERPRASCRCAGLFGPRGQFGSKMTPGPKARQAAKLNALREALITAGFRTLGPQSAALGLNRVTTWKILTGKHKASGLCSATIDRILASPNLPLSVRAVVLEYAEERRAGLYGHKMPSS